MGKGPRGGLGKDAVALGDHAAFKAGFPSLGSLPQADADVVDQRRVGGIVKWLDYFVALSMVNLLDDTLTVTKGKGLIMAHIKAAEAAIFNIPGVVFAGLVSPNRGSTENAVWRVTLAPGTPGAEHSLTREEVLVALSGEAEARIGGEVHRFAAGDAIVVPAGVGFALANPGSVPFEAIAVLPVGGQARIGAEVFVPPWAL